MSDSIVASTSTAGNLFSGSSFFVPQYQREYSWTRSEVSDFWNDLKDVERDDTYFLGLVIFTTNNNSNEVIDGQQRLLTLSLLAKCIYDEAIRSERKALANNIRNKFLYRVDYETDKEHLRVVLADDSNNKAYHSLVQSSVDSIDRSIYKNNEVSLKLYDSYIFLKKSLREDIQNNPFKKLGQWASLITDRLLFAVFTHPDGGDAYRVFEVINTRGKELATNDLLKNRIIKSTPDNKKNEIYERWQSLAYPFRQPGFSNFVQFIRHSMTVAYGHVLPRELYKFISKKIEDSSDQSKAVIAILDILDKYHSLYQQMEDQSLGGDASDRELEVYSALGDLGVISVRPILLAGHFSDSPDECAIDTLRLIVRRMVVGSIGTGNVERRLGDCAHKIFQEGSYSSAFEELSDLNPDKNDFKNKLKKRAYSKKVLYFLRSSIEQNKITPNDSGYFHYIMQRNKDAWVGLNEEEFKFWSGTISNTVITSMKRRPAGIEDWESFRNSFLEGLTSDKVKEKLSKIEHWNVAEIEKLGAYFAEKAEKIWYG